MVEDAFLLLTRRYIGVDCTAAAVFYARSLALLPITLSLSFSFACERPGLFLLLYYGDVLNGISYQFRQSPNIVRAVHAKQ